MFKCKLPITSPPTTQLQRTIEDVPEAHSAEIHPVQMTKILRDIFQDPQTVHKYTKTSGQESSDRLFYITGIPHHPGPGEYRGHTVLETFFQKLTERAITPHRTTPGSVGYDLFTPFDFEIQPQEQKIVFTDLAVNAPEGHYVQLMSKSGLIVSYELEVKAGVIDPDFTGNLGVVLKNNSNKYVKHAAGDSIAQLLFIKIAMPTLVLVPVLAKMQRGEHGFGAHTAK